MKLDHEVPQNFGKTAGIKIRADAFREDVRFWLVKVTVRDEQNDVDNEVLAQSWVHCKQDWRLFWVNKVCVSPKSAPDRSVKLHRPTSLNAFRDISLALATLG